jgi:hypothetical protein
LPSRLIANFADEGSAGEAVLDVELVESLRALFLQADRRPHPGELESLDASATDALVGIGHRDDDAVDA